MDTQDPKEPNVLIGFEIKISNPKFTPQPNMWAFKLVDYTGMFLDIKEGFQGWGIYCYSYVLLLLGTDGGLFLF